MNVLVTGATGRIGNNLARHLKNQGYQVRGTAIPGDRGIERATSDGIEVITGNLRDARFCAEAISGCDAVMHLGAMLLFGPDDDQDLFDDNVRSTFNMMEAAANQGNISRFVFASSDEVYPSLFARYLPIDETHPKEPYSFYGVTKLTGETMGDYFYRRRGLPVAVARFALTIEPWEVLYPERPLGNFLHLSSLLRFIRNRSGDEAADRVAALQVGDEPNILLAREEDGRPYLFQYCDVRDLVQGLQLLLEHPAAVGEAFNLSGPAPIAYDHAAGVLAEATGRHLVDVRLPGPPIRIHHSTAKARNMLGYNPVHDIRSTVDEAMRTDPGGIPA
ncbi:MAG: NAD-dependent epimerase/dehydratase family protein [Thermomicrobiales bacterium]